MPQCLLKNSTDRSRIHPCLFLLISYSKISWKWLFNWQLIVIVISLNIFLFVCLYLIINYLEICFIDLFVQVRELQWYCPIKNYSTLCCFCCVMDTHSQTDHNIYFILVSFPHFCRLYLFETQMKKRISLNPN